MVKIRNFTNKLHVHEALEVKCFPNLKHKFWYRRKLSAEQIVDVSLKKYKIIWIFDEGIVFQEEATNYDSSSICKDQILT